LFCSHLSDFSVRIQFPGENVPLQAFWPSSDFLVFWLDCSVFCGLFCPHLLGGLFLSTGYTNLVLPTHSLLCGLFCPHLQGGLFCILRIVLSASSGWIVLSTGYIYLVLSTISSLRIFLSASSGWIVLSTRSSLLDLSVRSFGALLRCSVLLLYRDPVAFLRRSGFCAACSLVLHFRSRLACGSALTWGSCVCFSLSHLSVCALASVIFLPCGSSPFFIGYY
jgi:hypothetical protein